MENTHHEKVSPKHVFLHLFVMIMLYVSTANVLTLLFQYINYWLSDPSTRVVYQTVYSADLIRFSIASVVIVFLLFILTSWFLEKSYRRAPEIREMRTRKWLIYFTLFVSALIITGDLVRIIWTFLQGEMTWRFILKALSVLVVTGLIFFYYLRNLRQADAVAKMKYFVYGVIVLVVAVVVAGFFVIGSPKTERARRFDLERVNHLQDIQWQIVNYWQKKEVLPPSLAALNDDLSGYRVPVDPETGAAYEYVAAGPASLSFELCATFQMESVSDEVRVGYDEVLPYPSMGTESWKHGAGRTCFSRTIDPVLYPPVSKTQVQMPTSVR